MIRPFCAEKTSKKDVIKKNYQDKNRNLIFIVSMTKRTETVLFLAYLQRIQEKW